MFLVDTNSHSPPGKTKRFLASRKNEQLVAGIYQLEITRLSLHFMETDYNTRDNHANIPVRAITRSVTAQGKPGSSVITSTNTLMARWLLIACINTTQSASASACHSTLSDPPPTLPHFLPRFTRAGDTLYSYNDYFCGRFSTTEALHMRMDGTLYVYALSVTE